MGDQGNIKGYFGAPVQQLKRKPIHLAESTAVNEKKTKSDNPTVRVRKFQGILEGQDVMYCSISYVEGIPPLQIYKVL